MAVITTKNPSSFKMRFDCGKDENNKTIVRNKTYSKIRPDATDEKVHIVASAMASLQSHTLIEVAKIDNSTISE